MSRKSNMYEEKRGRNMEGYKGKEGQKEEEKVEKEKEVVVKTEQR